jgi:alpha-ketoglutarate-dependent taurine dioxygenase
VWCYANALQEIARTSELQHLRFVQLGELLGHKSGVWTKKHTIQHASCLRRELLYKAAAAPGGFTSNIDGKDSPLQSYLTSRLPPVDDDVHNSVSSSLRARWYAYTSAIATTRADYIQITSYDVKPMQDCNALAISLLPQDERAVSLAPWDSVIVIETDGRYRSSTVGEVKDEEAYELVLDAAGSPSHYRAEADIWNWRADGLDVTFEHLYPTGTIIRPSSSYAGAAPSIQALPMHKVRIMAQRFSPVVLRGFRETTNEEYFLAKGNELGEILTWTFGQILKVKDSGEVDRNANNVTSNEAMPMHFDGIFKFVDTVDPVTGEVKKVLTPPRYQYFTCLSTAPKGDGYTLFANSRLFFQNLPAPFTLERLRKATWSMVNDGFWSAKQTELPLVVRHKETGAACLRWHQPWTETKFSKYFIEIENDEAAEELVNVINKLVYDYRVCLRFGWEQGDLLINDNVAMLHTRTAFSGACEREMWRIHFD